LAILDKTKDFVFTVEKNVTFNDFVDRFDEEVSGYWFSLRIKTPIVLDNCAVPRRSVLSTVNELKPLIIEEELQPIIIGLTTDDNILILTDDGIIIEPD
jgi:hypothetical protein